MTEDGRSFYAAHDLGEVGNLIRNAASLALSSHERASGRSMVTLRTYCELHGRLWAGASWDLGWAVHSDR